jgi:hypothetical protein
MKTSNLAVTLILLLVPALACGEGPAVDHGPAPIAIYMDFDGPYSSRAVEAMKREVEALTKASGLHLHWRLLRGRRGEESFSDLMVVKFNGKCNMEGIQLLFSELGPYGEGTALGSTKIVNGQVLPFSELECDRIRHSIAPLAIGYPQDERESLLGRAMGRVLAHELFHVFANTVKHGHDGVAKTTYSRKDLLAERFEFNSKDAKLIERH